MGQFFVWDKATLNMRGEMEEIMKVIMNADDFGFSKGVNHGILEGFQHGIITSTSLMVNMPGFDSAVELMKQYPDLLKVGLHLVTSVEYAITPNLKTLTDENNHFYHDAKLIHDCDLEELKTEYEAQLQKFLATGFKPTHIDFHWCHEPVQLEAAMYLAKKYDLPIRAGDKEIEALFTENNIRYAPNHISDFYNQKERTTEVETMLGLLQSSLDRKLEIIGFAVHPAYVDYDLLTLSSYNVQRAKEFHVLTDPKIMDFIHENKIEMISFADI